MSSMILSLLPSSKHGYAFITIVIALIAAIIAFIIAWKVSNWFIPPRYKWTKSGYAVFMIKLSMAAGAAFYTFIAVLSLLVANY